MMMMMINRQVQAGQEKSLLAMPKLRFFGTLAASASRYSLTTQKTLTFEKKAPRT